MTALASSLTKAATETLLPPAAQTTTLNGTAVDIQKYEGVALIVLDSAAGTGTTPTLNVKLQESDTSGGTFTDVSSAAFTQVGAGASQQNLFIDVSARKRWIRAVATIAGTTPSFTCSCDFVG